MEKSASCTTIFEFGRIGHYRRVPKKTTNVWTYVQTVGNKYGWVFLSHTFSEKKKVWTKNFRVGRSDIDNHTYKSMQNLKYGDGRDLFPMALKGLLYILSPP